MLSNLLKYFDLTEFELIEEIPENLSKIQIQNYPHIFNDELYEIEVLEFVGNKLSRFNGMSRLDKYLNLDFVAEFEKPSFYESKYFSLQSEYLEAITKASQVTFSQYFLNKCEYYKNIFKSLPLLILPDNLTSKNYNLPFQECYYISDTQIENDFFEQNNLKATNIKSLIESFPIDFDINILCFYLSNYFEEIYGLPYDLRFSLMCKNKYKNNKDWQIKLLDCEFAFLKNNELKTIYENKSFTFSKKDLNLYRSNLTHCLRFCECFSR